MEYRKHLQAFIDRWRYNANRAAQAQSKIKILEKVKSFVFCHPHVLSEQMQLPELTPPVAEETEKFRCVSSLSRMRSILIFAAVKVPGDGEDFSAPAPAFGGDIRIRSFENHFESHQF